MQRIICHWTAGGSRASDDDRKHYHRIVEQDGTVVRGTETIADNIVTSDGDYAAHTLHLNTGSIGIAMAGMRDAIEYPFSPGPSPINEHQFTVFCSLVAELCREYSIPVTPQTVLTHAEVETTLGVKQRGKWDIAVLPWGEHLTGSRAVGDHMRATVSAMLGVAPVPSTNRPTLRFGDRGVSVAELQTDLAELGYFSGRTDGIFGALTRASLLAFQADQGIGTDAVAGAMTWAALAKAEPRPPRDVTQAEIDAESGTAKDARMTERVGDVMGIGGAATLVAQLSAASDTLSSASGALGRVTEIVTQNWPVVALCVVCLFGWLALRALGITTRKRRLRDAREHRSLAR
jgi:Putative peptidoglycan-binding domain-containing protein